MKQPSRSRAVLIGALAACLVAFGGALAGSLTPPGPPAPTMKTLDQVEARIPISSLPYTISTPGSYYLTGNLIGASGQNGITVTVDDVTIDLNGFALVGVATPNSGISAGTSSLKNLTIRNGTIRDWGQGVGPGSGGVFAPDALNVLFEDLLVTGNVTGVDAGSGIIRHVLARGNATYGIILQNQAGGTIEDCLASENGGTGILVSYNTIIANNNVYHNGGAGIFVFTSGNRIEANHLVSNGAYGINCTGSASGNVIIKNTAINNTSGNYFIGPGNDVGPIGTAATATSPWANLSD